MSPKHVYYDGGDISRRPLCYHQGIIEYRIHDGVMHVYWGGQSCKARLKKGETYAVIVNRHQRPEIAHNLPPARPADILAWLLGFTASARTQSRSVYDGRFQKLQASAVRFGNPRVGYQVSGSAYSFLYFGPDPAKFSPIISYVDSQLRIDAGLVREIFVAFGDRPVAFATPIQYPAPYVAKIFRDSLGLTPSDCDSLLTAFPELFPSA